MIVDVHESTFSRAFAAFAHDELPQKIHAAMVRQHRSQQLAGHVSRDATAIDGREKPASKPKPVPTAPRSQVAIPLAQMTAGRVTSLYEYLMFGLIALTAMQLYQLIV